MVAGQRDSDRVGRIGQVVDQAVYVTAADSVLVSLWSRSTAVLTLSVNIRLLLLSGEIVQVNRDVDVAGTTVRLDVIIPVYDGWILAVGVVSGGARVSPGRVFARVDLLQGSLLAAARRQVMGSGYVTSGRGIIWPGGQNEDGTDLLPEWEGANIAAPGAGVQWSSLDVGVGQREFIGVTFTLTTSATVATRQVYLSLIDNATEVVRLPAQGTQLASLVRTYFAIYGVGVLAAAGSSIFIPLPQLRMGADNRISSVCDNFQAGDAYTGIRLQYYPAIAGMV